MLGIVLALPPTLLIAIATAFRAVQGQGAIFTINALIIVVSFVLSALLFRRLSREV